MRCDATEVEGVAGRRPATCPSGEIALKPGCTEGNHWHGDFTTNGAVGDHFTARRTALCFDVSTFPERISGYSDEVTGVPLDHQKRFQTVPRECWLEPSARNGDFIRTGKIVFKAAAEPAPHAEDNGRYQPFSAHRSIPETGSPTRCAPITLNGRGEVS